MLLVIFAVGGVCRASKMRAQLLATRDGSEDVRRSSVASVDPPRYAPNADTKTSLAVYHVRMLGFTIAHEVF